MDNSFPDANQHPNLDSHGDANQHPNLDSHGDANQHPNLDSHGDANSITPYDFNGDGVIDVFDVSAVAASWMDPALYDPRFDVAPSGQPDTAITIADVVVVTAIFGQACP